MPWQDLQQGILEEFESTLRTSGHCMDPLLIVSTHALEKQKEYLKEYVKRPEVASRIKAAGRGRQRAPLTDPAKIEKRLAQKRAYAQRVYEKKVTRD